MTFEVHIKYKLGDLINNLMINMVLLTVFFNMQI